jgi:DNA-binding NarL/FixJ family response regulator
LASVQVVTIEDDRRYRTSLEALFGLTSDFALAASFASATEALVRLDADVDRGAAPHWDVILMDLQLPGLDGIEATRRVHRLLPSAHIVALTVFEEPSTVVAAICAGAEGYILKRTPPDELLDQLRAVVNGGSPLTPAIARTLLDLVRRIGPSSSETAPPRFDLTDREQDVLRCLVQGMAYKTTASELDISIDTVRSHVRSVYRKLQVHSVAQAVGRALRDGLV